MCVIPDIDWIGCERASGKKEKKERKTNKKNGPIQIQLWFNAAI